MAFFKFLNYFNLFGSNKSTYQQIPEKLPKESEDKGKGFKNPDAFSDVWSLASIFEETFTKESDEILKFREMGEFDIVNDVIFDAINESFTILDNNKFFKLNITNTDLDSHKRKYIEEKFDEFYQQFNFNRILHDLIEEYLITSKLYIEKIYQNGKFTNIKILPAESMGRIVNSQTGEIQKFFQIVKNKKDPVVFDKNEIVYLSFGKTPYLRNTISLYNKLKILDPSLIIYRFARAPERFLFKIFVGRMPRDKAWAYVNEIKKNLNQKFEISNNGEIKGEKAFKSFLSNFYLPITSDDRSSDIQSIAGNNSLDELKDFQIFIKRMYLSLHYPLSRVEGLFSDSFSSTIFTQRPDSITNDEKKWVVFLLNSIQIPFRELIKYLFIEYLRNNESKSKEKSKEKDIEIQGNENKNENLITEFQTNIDVFYNQLKDISLPFKNLNINVNDIKIYSEGSNDIEKIKEQELFEIKLNNYGTMREYKEFSKIYLLKKIFKFSDNDIDELIKLNNDKRNDNLLDFIKKNTQEDEEGY